MKLRTSLLACALCAGCGMASAQNTTEEFNPHWYMQVQAGAAHTVGETTFKNLISPAAALNVGYQFNPVWGLRFGLSGWQAKGAWTYPLQKYKYNYLQGNVDATLNLSNLFCHYNEKRFFNAYLFGGVGINGAFNNDEAVAIAAKGYNMEYLWTKNKISPVGRFGLGADFRLARNVYFNLEVNANVLSDKFNSKKAGNADWQFNALAGFTFKFGKKAKKTVPASYIEPAKPAQQPTPEPKEEPKPEPKPEKKVESLTENIFFKINSSYVRSSEQTKIQRIVDYLKAHPEAKVSIVGYADKQTGNYKINQRISKRRSASVASELKKAGISADRISTAFKGDTEQPFSTMTENRVCICIAE